jgi:hypothetical protein
MKAAVRKRSVFENAVAKRKQAAPSGGLSDQIA